LRLNDKKKYICFKLSSKHMPIIRRYQKKDGTIVVRQYDKIKGIDANEYKKLGDKKYRATKRRVRVRKQGQLSPKRKTKAEQLPDTMLKLIHHYRDIGLSLDRIASNLKLTRFTVTKALAL
jgi:hypothetical protein